MLDLFESEPYQEEQQTVHENIPRGIQEPQMMECPVKEGEHGAELIGRHGIKIHHAHALGGTEYYQTDDGSDDCLKRDAEQDETSQGLSGL